MTTEYLIQPLEEGQLQIRKTVDGKHHRYVIDVGDDVSNEIPEIQEAAAEHHTTEKIAARKEFLEAQEKL